MSDEIALSSVADELTSHVANQPTPAPASVGQQLRAARDVRGMTIAEVAKSLKLSMRQIEALEADDWQSLPCKTIIRGFVRNYARLLNLDSDLLMSRLDGIEMPHAPELELASGTPVNLASDRQVDRRDYVRVVSGLLILILAVLVTFLFPRDMWESTVSAFKAAMQPNETAVEQAAVEPTPPAEVPAASEVAAPAPDAPQETSAADAAPVSADTPAQQEVQPNVLKFSFDRAAWVEVRDHNGEILLSQLNSAGSQREVEGRPPFSVVIGNAGHVSLQYKGQPVDLSKRSKDDVARLSLE